MFSVESCLALLYSLNLKSVFFHKVTVCMIHDDFSVHMHNRELDESL